MTMRDAIAAGRLAAAALLLAALLSPAGGQAATLGATVTAVNAVDAQHQHSVVASPAAAAPLDMTPPLSDSEAQGYGCLISGGLATGLTMLAGSDHLIKIVAGGTIGPATPAALIVALTGTVFASVCAVGALATSALMRLYDLYGRAASGQRAP